MLRLITALAHHQFGRRCRQVDFHRSASEARPVCPNQRAWGRRRKTQRIIERLKLGTNFHLLAGRAGLHPGFEAAVPRSLYLHQALGSDRNLDQVEGGCAAGGDELPIHAHLSVVRLHHDAKYARSYQRRETRPDLGGPVDALDAHCLREWLVAVRLNGQQTVARLCLVQQASALRNGARLSSESYRGMLFSDLCREREGRVRPKKPECASCAAQNPTAAIANTPADAARLKPTALPLGAAAAGGGNVSGDALDAAGDASAASGRDGGSANARTEARTGSLTRTGAGQVRWGTEVSGGAVSCPSPSVASWLATVAGG